MPHYNEDNVDSADDNADDKADERFVPFYRLNNRVVKHRCLALFQGPGRFRELREARLDSFRPILVPLRLYGDESWPKTQGGTSFPSTV